jgi:hypothetical protein
MRWAAILAILIIFVFAGGAMGYDLHITRGESWADSEEHPIPIDEWRKIVKNDASLEPQEHVEATNPQTGEVIRMETPGGAVWTNPESGSEVFFGYRSGKISVKNPDEPTIGKMKRLAALLAARVLGDEDEEY